MARKIITNISTDQLNQTIKELKAYADRLTYRCELFVEELANVGIFTVKQNTFVEGNGKMTNHGDLVYFTKQITGGNGEADCTLIAEANTYFTQWETKEGMKIAQVNPLLMAEFGSGAKAIDGHRGSFPEQIHAFDEKGWWWVDASGNKHHSRGNAPTRPLLKAKETMKQQIHEVAERVFQL